MVIDRLCQEHTITLLDINKVNPITVGNFAFLFKLHASVSEFRLYDGSNLKKDLSIDEMVKPVALAVCQAHRGLPVGFLLFRYSVFSLLIPYLCFISLLYLALYVLGEDALIS